MSLCNGCGKCCWNWVAGIETRDETACEHLSRQNFRRCLIYDEWEEHNLDQCRVELTLKQASSLPDECGYVQEWLSHDLIERDPNQPAAVNGQQRWRVKAH